MRKNEFMDLLRYYFRKSDKNDLKGIIEDCEEQFRIGAKEGRSEEEICCKLGHPKNIYRYYIGEPIVPEDNPRMPGDEYGAYGDFGPGVEDRVFYDQDRDDEYYCQQQLAQQQRRYDREQVMRQRYAAEAAKTGKDFNWNDGDSQMGKAAKAVASPFMDVLGTLFGILSGFLYLALAIVILAAIGISFIPAYAYTDLLPLPTLPGDAGPRRPDGPLRRHDGQLGQPGLPRRSPREGGAVNEARPHLPHPDTGLRLRQLHILHEQRLRPVEALDGLL